MKILKEGEAHKRDVFYAECKFCGTQVRILDGDPRSYKEWRGFNDQGYRFWWICPICGSLEEGTTGVMDNTYGDRVKKVKDELITMEDKKEIESWETDPLDDINEDQAKVEHVRAWDHIRNARRKLGIPVEEEDPWI